MKEIKAVFQPFMLHAVLDALHQIPDLPAVAISEIRVVSTSLGLYEQVVKMRLEIIVSDDLVETVMKAIQIHAHTGKPGDGRIIVLPIESSLMIRTGEYEDDSAL